MIRTFPQKSYMGGRVVVRHMHEETWGVSALKGSDIRTRGGRIGLTDVVSHEVSPSGIVHHSQSERAPRGKNDLRHEAHLERRFVERLSHSSCHETGEGDTQEGKQRHHDVCEDELGAVGAKGDVGGNTDDGIDRYREEEQLCTPCGEAMETLPHAAPTAEVATHFFVTHAAVLCFTLGGQIQRKA